MFGIDCTSTGTKQTELAKAGVKFACRYLSTLGNPKNLTAAEAARLKAAAIAVVTVFESTGQTVKGGRSAGVSDAQAAARGLVAAAAPKGAPVYFAVDFDAQPADFPAIKAYFQGARAELGKGRVGCYAGYHVVAMLFDAGLIDFGWQTYAWSGGLWDKRAHLRQYRNAQKLAALDVDYDLATTGNYGQWAPPRVRPPKLTPKYVIQTFDVHGAVERTWTTRFPGLSLASYGVARRKPARIDIVRVP